MKVYWRDRNGHPPPADATFHCYPFLKEEKSPFSHHASQVATLPNPKQALVLNRTFLPSKEQWVDIVSTAIAKKIKKIVLARCEILELSEAPDPFAILATLKERAEGAYLFCLNEGETSFLGASPERLFARNGKQLISEAMAGTRERGTTVEEDETVGFSLLSNQKTRREFDPVVRFLKKNLNSFCEGKIEVSPISLHKTYHVQHLYAKISGILQKKIADCEIVDKIHPTPALCGTPPKLSAAWIKKLEPFPRGLYGGVVGWNGATNSEWIVGIRSCLIKNNYAYLYAGAGIVIGSDPLMEWEELNAKTALYSNTFKDVLP